MYSFTLFLTSALDGSGWLAPRPGRFTPGKDPVPIAYDFVRYMKGLRNNSYQPLKA